MFQFGPLIAFAGHACWHCLHVPHCDCVMGVFVFSGAFVSIDVSLSAVPCCGVTSSADFPIHPSPALVAIVLCGSGNWLFSPKSVPSLFLVCACALYPMFCRCCSHLVAIWSSLLFIFCSASAYSLFGAFFIVCIVCGVYAV